MGLIASLGETHSNKKKEETLMSFLCQLDVVYCEKNCLMFTEIENSSRDAECRIYSKRRKGMKTNISTVKFQECIALSHHSVLLNFYFDW